MFFRTATFNAGNGRPVRFWGSLQLGIGRVVRGRIGLCPGWSWRGCTSLFLGGWWQGCTGAFRGGCWRGCTGVSLHWHWRDHTLVVLMGHWRDRTSVLLCGCWRDRTSVFLSGRAGSILRSILGPVHRKLCNIALTHFLFSSHSWWCSQWEHLAFIGGWRWNGYRMVHTLYWRWDGTESIGVIAVIHARVLTMWHYQPPRPFQPKAS